jgi:5-formyltetrahydrofolate cyclo-ligase
MSQPSHPSTPPKDHHKHHKHHKHHVRRQALAARDALTPEQRAHFSALICTRAEELPEIAHANTVMVFASFRSEIDTDPLIAWAIHAGKSVCLPRIVGPRLMQAHRIRDPWDELVPGTWDIPEPTETCEVVEPHDIDVVVVPGAAFDPSGNRCGYGGGFYDTFLRKTREGVPRVALAFEAQMVEDLPCEEHDLPVTAIVTEERVIRPE